jgi:hypothetical protein
MTTAVGVAIGILLVIQGFLADSAPLPLVRIAAKSCCRTHCRKCNSVSCCAQATEREDTREPASPPTATTLHLQPIATAGNIAFSLPATPQQVFRLPFVADSCTASTVPLFQRNCSFLI